MTLSVAQEPMRKLGDPGNETPFSPGDRVVILQGPDAGRRATVIGVDFGSLVFIHVDGGGGSVLDANSDLDYRKLRYLDVLERLADIQP